MGDTQIPQDDHPQFDAMCSEVEDFQTLPTVRPVSAASSPDLKEEEERTAPLDELILGGLVSP
ncbi:MAG TPA: hypothetical protein VIJ20_04325 [Solirubrobacteraceae bacterium]